MAGTKRPKAVTKMGSALSPSIADFKESRDFRNCVRSGKERAKFTIANGRSAQSQAMIICAWRNTSCGSELEIPQPWLPISASEIP